MIERGQIDLQFIDQPSPIGFAFTGSGWFNTFTDIQNFVGSAAGNNSFQSVGSGDYSFTGKGGNNTLDYTYDTDQGVTVNLLTDTAGKDITISAAANSVRLKYPGPRTRSATSRTHRQQRRGECVPKRRHRLLQFHRHRLRQHAELFG